jgi:hypothetical protein
MDTKKKLKLETLRENYLKQEEKRTQLVEQNVILPGMDESAKI